MTLIKKFFKFISSVRLAVPTMLLLGVCVGVGTVLESRYNADYARLLVYRAPWFYALLAVLWINIFAAMVSRYPFKKHHTGFVLTHIGLLTLLIGSFITSAWGTDGQLTLQEGSSGNTVVLDDYVIEIKNESKTETYKIPRWSAEKNLGYHFGKDVVLKKYIPFAEAQDHFVAAEEGWPAVEFILKSPFFTVSEGLSLNDKPFIQMGPATFRIISSDAQSPDSQDSLFVLDSTGKTVLRKFSVAQLRQGTVTVNGIGIRLIKVYKRAEVEKSKLFEGKSGWNPAIEIMLSQNKQEMREISYAQFPEFSLHKNPPFGLRMHYVSQNQEVLGNTISFIVTANDKALVQFSKNGKPVSTAVATVNGPLDTPWMGMKLTLTKSLLRATKETVVRVAQIEEKKPLPAPALQFQIGSDSVWLMEGDSVTYSENQMEYRLSYGKNSVKLPFTLTLAKFVKEDYPGTQTPLAFESTVKSDDGSEEVISMNNPLKKAGYTLYQASFIEDPGNRPYSVFSVNRDPGRWTKYLGSIILAIGIITFTLMRSKTFKKWSDSRK